MLGAVPSFPGGDLILLCVARTSTSASTLCMLAGNFLSWFSEASRNSTFVRLQMVPGSDLKRLCRRFMYSREPSMPMPAGSFLYLLFCISNRRAYTCIGSSDARVMYTCRRLHDKPNYRTNIYPI